MIETKIEDQEKVTGIMLTDFGPFLSKYEARKTHIEQIEDKNNYVRANQ